MKRKRSSAETEMLKMSVEDLEETPLLDIILSSFKSSEYRSFVTSQRLPTTGIDFKIGKTSSEVRVQLADGRESVWKFWPDLTMTEDVPMEYIDVEEAGPMENKTFFRVNIDDNTVLKHCIRGPDTIHTFFEPVAPVIRKLVNHLVTLFPSTNFNNISIDMDMIPYPEWHLPFGQCKQLHVKWGHRRFDDVWKNVLERLPAEFGLSLEMGEASSFDFKNVPVNYDFLELNHCQWLKPEKLMTYNCRRLILNPRESLRFMDFNDYLMKWFEGSIDLEMLEVCDRMDWSEKHHLSLDGKIDRSSRKRGKYFRHNDKLFDFSLASDYIRDDGVEASLVHRRDKGFLFVTWKHPQHSVKPPSGMYYSTLHVDDFGWMYPVYHRACTYRDDSVMIDYQRIMDNIIN